MTGYIHKEYGAAPLKRILCDMYGSLMLYMETLHWAYIAKTTKCIGCIVP